MVPQPLAVTTSIAREIMPADHLILVFIVLSSSLLGGETGLPVGLNGSPVKGDPGGWIRSSLARVAGTYDRGPWAAWAAWAAARDRAAFRSGGPAIGDGRGR